MKPNALLRWYPRAWREQYGEELLALIQDTMDEGRPTWRLRLSVIWAGLRERGHRARRAVRATVKRPAGSSMWVTALVAGAIAAGIPHGLAAPATQARGWPATAAFDAVLAAGALTGAMVLADGLMALPALVRFVRMGGWPKIRRRVAWAAGVSAMAGGGLAGLAVAPAGLASGSLSFPRPNAPWAYLAGFLATVLAITVAIGLWAIAAAGTARHLTLSSRVRAAQLILGAVTPTAVSGTLVAINLWWSATQSASWLVWALALAFASIVSLGLRLPRAVRKGRRLRAAASGAATVNPSAQRTNGRHRA